MTNLEKYLGLRIFITRDIDPFLLSNEKNALEKLQDLVGFDLNEFFIYEHTLNLFIRNNVHYKKISDKLLRLEILFKVNPKQEKTGQIKFFNSIVFKEEHFEEGVIEERGAFDYKRQFEGWYLDNHRVIKSKLITRVHKSLVKQKHRKIKVNVSFSPKEELNIKPLTALDLNLDDEVKLNFKGLSAQEISDIQNIIFEQRKGSFSRLIESQKAEKIVNNFSQGEIFNIEIENHFDKLRELNINKDEVEELKKYLRKAKRKADYPVKKKITSWLGKLATKSIEFGVEYNMPAIMEVLQKIFPIYLSSIIKSCSIDSNGLDCT